MCIVYSQLIPSYCLYIAAADAKKAEIQAKKDADAKKAAEAAAARKEEAGMSFLSCWNNTFTWCNEVLSYAHSLFMLNWMYIAKAAEAKKAAADAKKAEG